MLSHIHINSLGIIDDLEIEFGKGLNIITGETGAGKTLVIGSIQMISGNKVSKDLIRNGKDKAFVEALFYIENDLLKNRVKELGYDSDEIVIYREITRNGRAVNKVNGHLVSVSELKELGEILIDLHGQHDNQFLLDSRHHIEVIDNFAGDELKTFKDEYLTLYNDRKRILDDIERLGGEPEKRARTIEFLKFQLDEIKEASLKSGEEEELNDRRKVLANAEKIAQNLSFSYDAISGERGAINCLEVAKSKLSEIINIDERYSKIFDVLNEAYYGVEDAAQSLSSEIDGLFIDDGELNTIDERLDLIFRLKRKYGKSIDEILATYESMEKEYSELCNSEELVNNLNLELKNVESELTQIANNISQLRKKVASSLEKRLEEILKELMMPKSRFEIKVLPLDKFLTSGMDDVEILFSSNLGEDVKPLSKVASGGEISRIMLALKNVLSNADIIPVMVFDEIDTGISGKAGFAVGEKMHEIANNKQVICVTHLPSIAAKGDTNFFISKDNIDDRTVTSVKRLNEDETIYEIARIISGGNISDTALMHAKEIRSC